MVVRSHRHPILGRFPDEVSACNKWRIKGLSSPVVPPTLSQVQHGELTSARPYSDGSTGRSNARSVNIALINVRFSPNLGDGLLSECLEGELRRHLPESSFVTVDLAGRTEYSTGSRLRRPLMKLLMLAPGPLRRLVVRQVFNRLIKRLAFSEALEGCHAAVLGGGNLLADADLNFPLKIAHAAQSLRKSSTNGLPFVIYAVGASRNWSVEGSGLFRQVLAMPSLISIAVRDELSRKALLAQAPDQLRDREIRLVRDPGLLAARHFSVERGIGARPIGICITDPLALRYHGGKVDTHALIQWFEELVAALVTAGHDILLFTNGSPEDRHCLDRHTEQWQRVDPVRVRVAPPAADPAGLMQIVAGCSLVIAHRMHACIAAHSLGIPTIGLRWDAKLDAFFDLASRSEYLHTAGTSRIEDVVISAKQTLIEGVDQVAQAELIAEAVNDVAVLARTLREVAT